MPKVAKAYTFPVKQARLLAILLLFPAAGCVPFSPQAEHAAPQPVFSPQAFFAGATAGDGMLRVGLSRSRQIHVVGHGDVGADGTLTLVQQVKEDARPPRIRTWRLHPMGGGKFAGTLSDARGPVRAAVSGNLLHIRFDAKGGLGFEQWLYLQPGGQTAFNRMVVRKFGIPVAVLRETIRRTS